jgi:AcrR family transcriptional regulator
MSKATGARQRIIAAARNSILAKGFGATSIDELIAEAEITKSGFFYHFKDKGELARVLLEEYIEEEEVLFDQIFDQGRDLADDPLQAFLISLKLLARMVEDLPTGHPGCLIATYCYQERLFDREVRDLNRKAVLAWRARFRATLDEIAERYPPKEEIDLDALADMVSTVLEGGIVMSKALARPRVLSEQVLLFRNLLKAMFLPEAQLSRPAARA